MRGERGFGIVTVMVGAVVLGIFAMVYTQQMQNRANISLIGDLMAFREQVITYYGSVVANRSTWECTRFNNTTLGTYLAGGVHPPSSRPRGPLDIYDYTGDCQEGFIGASTATLLVPSGNGLGLELQDHNDLPIAAVTCDSDIHHFCLKVEWEALDPDLGDDKRAVEVKLTLVANRKAIKNDLDVSFKLADKEYAIYMNRTVATDCSDGRVTGYFPGRAPGPVPHPATAPHMTGTGVNAYAGDTAVVNFDSITGLVECSPLGPLVVPPCYDMSDTSTIGGIKTNPFISRTGMPGYRGFLSSKGFAGIMGDANVASRRLQCDGLGDCCPGSATPPARVAIKGRCPETAGSGTTAIAYFDPQTGISQCSNPNILVEEVVETETAKNCDDTNRYGVVKIRGSDEAGGTVGTFQCSTDYWPGENKGGVEPINDNYPCSVDQAINKFDSDGSVSKCAEGDGLQTDAPAGFPGARGKRGRAETGPRGADAYATCNGTCGCNNSGWLYAC